MTQDKSVDLAYIIGVALGDGNLSNPNKRAVRLRITCDSKYPSVAEEIISALQRLFPTNKVTIQSGPRDSYFNISVYSNKLTECIPWKVGHGTKITQNANVPQWIRQNTEYTRACLRGLLQTDGSIYVDRSYVMVNFTNNILTLAECVQEMMESLGYQPHLYQAKQRSGNPKYTIRLSRKVDAFLSEIKLIKN